MMAAFKKFLKALFIISIVGTGLIGAFYCHSFLRENKFWPYATGTNTVAFGRTTFGMSRKEVLRTIREEIYLDQAVDNDKDLVVKKWKEITRACPIINVGGYPMVPESRNRNLLITTKQLYDRDCVVTYIFDDDRLVRVDLEIGATEAGRPNGAKTHEELFALIRDGLKSLYSEDSNGHIDIQAGKAAIVSQYVASNANSKVVLFVSKEGDKQCLVAKNYWRPFHDEAQQEKMATENNPFSR